MEWTDYTLETAIGRMSSFSFNILLFYLLLSSISLVILYSVITRNTGYWANNH